MIEGKYFRIPEGPLDIEMLWRRTPPLEPTNLPSWLTPEDSSEYRCVASASCAGLSADDQENYFAEIEQIEYAGLIADPYPNNRHSHRIYLPAKQKNKYDLWSIGIYCGDSPFHLGPAPGVQNPVLTREHVSDVPAVFVADPFMIRSRDLWYMFFEVLNWRTDKGEIGLATSEDGLAWKYRQIVLAEPFHLSYPHVLRWKNYYYMIPECCRTGSVRLYKAVEFPLRWSFAGTLLEGPHFVDASPFRFKGKWWLFTETNPNEKHDTLRLYHAGDLSGPWVEHPQSPIVEADPRAARPGGRVVVTGDRIIRYSQDCWPDYGTRVRAFKLMHLTTAGYAESEAEESPVLSPGGTGWNAAGMHHIDVHRMAGGRWLACVDGWVKATEQAASENHAEVA